MAKRGTLDHPKTRRAARQLKTVPGVILGLLETIWHQTSEFHTDGRMTKLDIEDALDAGGWLSMFEVDKVITTLSHQDCTWLDQLPNGDWYVHDWHNHAEDSVHSKLYRSVQLFANGTKPLPKKVSTQEIERLEPRWQAATSKAAVLSQESTETSSAAAATNEVDNSTTQSGSRTPPADTIAAAAHPTDEPIRQPALALALALTTPKPLPLPATAATATKIDDEDSEQSPFIPPRQSDLSVLERFKPPLRQSILQVAIEYCLRRYGGSKHSAPWYQDLLNEIGSVLEVQTDPAVSAMQLITTCKSVIDVQLSRKCSFTDIAIYCGLQQQRGQVKPAGKSQDELKLEQAMQAEFERQEAKMRPAPPPPSPPPRSPPVRRVVSKLASSLSAGEFQ